MMSTASTQEMIPTRLLMVGHREGTAVMAVGSVHVEDRRSNGILRRSLSVAEMAISGTDQNYLNSNPIEQSATGIERERALLNSLHDGLATRDGTRMCGWAQALPRSSEQLAGGIAVVGSGVVTRQGIYLPADEGWAYVGLSDGDRVEVVRTSLGESNEGIAADLFDMSGVARLSIATFSQTEGFARELFGQHNRVAA